MTPKFAATLLGVIRALQRDLTVVLTELAPRTGSNTDNKWDAELRDAKPYRMAALLAHGQDRLRRLHSITQRGQRRQRPMFFLVQAPEAKFKQLYPVTPTPS